MRVAYFKTAWVDIVRSPGWFKKLLLLALVSLVPVFGMIVVYGYLFGWARDMAWGVHAPMPKRVFGNEDGKLYMRGLSVLAITIVFSLVPIAMQLVGSAVVGGDVIGIGFLARTWRDAWSWWIVGPVLGVVSAVASFALGVLALQLSWVGSMRASIYDRASAGFQLARIWVMVRHDTQGLLRIFGMTLLIALVAGVVLAGVAMVTVYATAYAGMVAMDGSLGFGQGFEGWYFDFGTTLLALIGAVAGVSSIALLASYLLSLAHVFALMMTVRALGHWTYQFDVPHWGGQEDPLPFERPSASV